MLLSFLSLLFAGPINASDLLDLNFYQFVNVKPNASDRDLQSV
jgi:hypothetical protein